MIDSLYKVTIRKPNETDGSKGLILQFVNYNEMWDTCEAIKEKYPELEIEKPLHATKIFRAKDIEHVLESIESTILRK